MAEKAADQSVAHRERDGSDINVKDTQAWSDARAANEDEHSLTIREALKQFRWAVTWSLVVSMSIIMEGYDTNLIGNVSSELLMLLYDVVVTQHSLMDRSAALRIPSLHTRLWSRTA